MLVGNIENFTLHENGFAKTYFKTDHVTTIDCFLITFILLNSKCTFIAMYGVVSLMKLIACNLLIEIIFLLMFKTFRINSGKFQMF